MEEQRLTYLDTVLEDIKNESFISRRTLLKRFKHCVSERDLDEIIKELKQWGEIKEQAIEIGYMYIGD